MNTLTPEVTLKSFPLDNVGKTSMLTYDLVKIVKDAVIEAKLFPEYLHIQSVSYYNNKRGFVVTLSDRKRHFIRPIIKKDINLIYLGRRLVGQPHCCAKAHAINTGLPGSFTAPEKFKTLEAVNLIPCRECFTKSEHEYLREVKQHQSKLMYTVGTENVNLVFAAALVYLINGDTDDLLEHEDMAEINSVFFMKSIDSTIRGLTQVSTDGQAILDKSQSITDTVSISVLQLIENTVTSAIRIANDITQRVVADMTLNDCYELAEVMAQLRANLNNLNFTLKYKGWKDGEF